MTSRRQFLAASAATAGALTAVKARAAKTSSTGFPYTEFEARIARRDFRDMTKDVLPTPSLIVDQDLFQKNLKTMWDTTKANGIAIRPHVKVHKSVDVARIQLAHGGIGLNGATIAEAELMSNAGIKNVMFTKQPASRKQHRANRRSFEKRSDVHVRDRRPDRLSIGWNRPRRPKMRASKFLCP